MKRRLGISILLASVALVAVGSSHADVFQRGNVRVKFDAGFDPHALPRQTPAPIEAHIEGSIATTDGSHPPPLRWLEIELNRHGQLTTAGLPVCSAPLLQSTTTEQALARCGRSVVGRGDFEAEVSLGGDVPAAGRIIAFNSRIQGKAALMLHFFASVPVRFTLVVPLRIVDRSKGEFGTLLQTRVPKLAGGLGSITRIDLTIGRRYSHRGKRLSYLSSACPAPAGIGLALFAFARARFRFEGHPEIRSKLADTCRVRS
ncbi:MAG TPA: hypothetical protein VF009_11265 [Solirubrobacterales bacterium]